MNVTDLFNSKPEQQFKKGITESRQWLKESSVNSPVSGAITRRILNQRTDLLKYGPVAVMAAIDDVADFVGDVEEIGSSDVSGWVAQVERMLKENPPEAFEVEEGVNGEYDDEAGMAQGNLYTIAKAAEGLLDTIDDRDNLPEWVQEKIAKVEGMMVGAWNYMQSQKAQGIDPKVDEDVTKSSQRVDSLVTDALKIMRGSELNDAVLALKTVLGDREYNSRRGYYNFYVRQLLDMYGQQGVAETRRMDSYEKDVHASQQGFDRPANHRGLRQELAHEKNNLQVTINGKPWKVIPGKGYADSQEERNYLQSMKSWAEKKSAFTGKKWSVSLTGADVSESQKKSDLDEVSTELLGRYKTAAAADAKKSDAAGNYKRGDKRFAGINRATIKQFDNDLKKHGQQGMTEGERGRGRPTAGEWDQTSGKAGRVEKTATGIRHHADPSRYGGTEPDRDDDRLLSKAQLHRLDKATEPEVDEGWKSRLAGAALAGAAALGAGGAQARVTPDGQGGFTGGLKPTTTVTSPSNNTSAQATAPMSREQAQAQFDIETRILTYKGKQYKWDPQSQATGQGEVVSAPSMAVGSRSMGPTNVELNPNGTYTKAAINEDSSTSSSDVESAVTRRILTQHTDLLMKYGPQKVMQAIEEVAYDVGDLDEIGTSDISSWVQQVKRILGAA